MKGLILVVLLVLVVMVVLFMIDMFFLNSAVAIGMQRMIEAIVDDLGRS